MRHLLTSQSFEFELIAHRYITSTKINNVNKHSCIINVHLNKQCSTVFKLVLSNGTLTYLKKSVNTGSEDKDLHENRCRIKDMPDIIP